MSGVDLCFVSAADGSGFMNELLEVVADAVRRAGYAARTAVGGYPPPGPDTVYVVVPHEYFAVTPAQQLPSPELRERTIAFCVEHPGTTTFERTATHLPGIAGVVDINKDSTAELRRRGFAVQHFQLGYTPLWDHWGGNPDNERDVDVTYLGTAERRRSRLLASYWRDLESLRVRLLTPPHEPMGPPRPDFLPGAAKFDHLARSRLLLNLHRSMSRALEWVRILEAMCNGCVVVTEPSTDLAPLVPGKQLVVARAEALGAVSAALANEPERERDLRLAAYEFAREHLDLLASAKSLAELAVDIARGASTPPVDGAPVDRLTPDQERRGSTARPLAVDTPSWDARFTGQLSLDNPTSADRRAQAASMAAHTSASRRTAARQWVRSDYGSVFPDAERVDVDVLLVQRPGEAAPETLVRDLLSGTVLPGRILVAKDGAPAESTEGPYGLLLHQAPLGRGLTRNSLLEVSKARRLLVVDSGMRASRYLLERLAAEEADVVHCPVRDPIDGMVGALPPELRRLRQVPYLGSGYLVTRQLVDQLGGWSEEPLLEDFEDHIFWSQVARGGHSTILLQQVLLERLRPDPLPRPIDSDPFHVWQKANSDHVFVPSANVAATGSTV